MLDLYFQQSVLTLFHWSGYLITLVGLLAAMKHRQISPRMPLVAAGFGGLLFCVLYNHLVRFFINYFAYPEEQQAVVGISQVVYTVSWGVLVFGVFAVVRDLAERLQFSQEQQKVRGS